MQLLHNPDNTTCTEERLLLQCTRRPHMRQVALADTRQRGCTHHVEAVVRGNLASGRPWYPDGLPSNDQPARRRMMGPNWRNARLHLLQCAARIWLRHIAPSAGLWIAKLSFGKTFYCASGALCALLEHHDKRNRCASVISTTVRQDVATSLHRAVSLTTNSWEELCSAARSGSAGYTHQRMSACTPGPLSSAHSPYQTRARHGDRLWLGAPGQISATS